jgi:Ribosomal silencing factor during starvation
MAAAALVRSARCHACRHDVVQPFVRVSGPRIAQSLRLPNEQQTRRFFAAPNLRIESSYLNSEENNKISELSQNSSASDDSTKSSQSVPWYLQMEPATELVHPLKRQEIPPAPEDAPPILHDMLQHLGNEIGLDGMTLLDLRGRDPPSALGSSLIMIIGTTRSVKHLNVSADRFCRWLRSTYKLRPYADGLLGRNELKIKLRRKTRRARLASSSGTVADSSDDGITTGWICVNVGSVDDPSAIQNMREGGFEGFGKVQGGTRIVVQMFTEEKRADVDLEKLWAPKRDKKAQSDEASSESIFQEDHQVRSEFDMSSEHNSNQPIPNVPRPTPHLPIDQKRSFSTSCRRKDNLVQNDLNQNANVDSEAVDQNVISLYLKGLSSEDVIEQLGNGPKDKSSTEFLQNCYSSVGSGSDYYKDSNLRLILAAAGVSAQHPKYTKEYLWASFLEHTGSGLQLNPDMAIDVASAFLVPRLEGQEGKRTSLDLVDFDIESALRVLDYLSLEGANMITKQQVFNLTYKTLTLRLLNEDTKSIQEKALRIRNLMTTLDFVWTGDISRETMQLRLMVGDVEGFYEIWHAIPFHEGSRTAKDYELLFGVHAEVGNPVYARDCLADWTLMMGRESHPIQPQGDLISAIARCALVAGHSSSNFRLTSVSDEWHEAHPLIVQEMELLEQSA